MKILSILFIFILININTSFSECNFGICNVDNDIRGSNIGNSDGITDSIVGIILYILTFTGLLAVFFSIKGGFQILTASSDDEKVKNGKKTVLYSLLGVFIIMIAYTIVSAIFTAAETISK